MPSEKIAVRKGFLWQTATFCHWKPFLMVTFSNGKACQQQPLPSEKVSVGKGFQQQALPSKKVTNGKLCHQKSFPMAKLATGNLFQWQRLPSASFAAGNLFWRQRLPPASFAVGKGYRRKRFPMAKCCHLPSETFSDSNLFRRHPFAIRNLFWWQRVPSEKVALVSLFLKSDQNHACSTRFGR